MTLPNIPNRKLTEISNGVIDERGRFYPFTVINLSQAGNISFPPSGTRYYVKTGLIAVRTIAADTTSLIYIVGVQESRNVTFCFASPIPSVAQSMFVSTDINLLFDPGTSIYISWDNIPTSVAAVLFVAVIDDV